jgi:hypothetical protein
MSDTESTANLHLPLDYDGDSTLGPLAARAMAFRGPVPWLNRDSF